MSQTNPLAPVGPHKIRNAYLQLGLEPGASMRNVETAYWRFARELRGQPAMTPYTAAYEALASRGGSRVNEARSAAPSAPAAPTAPTAPAETPPAQSRLVSKFGWPAN